MTIAVQLIDRDTAPQDGGESSLLPSVAGGDDEAMAMLWLLYAGRVRGLARSLSRAKGPDTDDVVQETFTKVWRAAGTYDPERGTEATFVFTIARRVIIDRWRRVQHRPRETLLHDHHRPMPHEQATDHYDRLMTTRAIGEALMDLSPAHREIIELSYLQGLSQSEIAERIGLPVGTVKTRTFRALRNLRRQLRDYSPES